MKNTNLAKYSNLAKRKELLAIMASILVLRARAMQYSNWAAVAADEANELLLAIDKTYSDK